MSAKEQARKILRDFKGDSYAFGLGVFDELGAFAARAGRTAMLVSSVKSYPDLIKQAMASLEKHGVKLVPEKVISGARPNTPREDVYRVETCILHHQPDCVVSIGGGSLIDGLKASVVLAGLGKTEPDIEAYFGVGLVTEAMKKTGVKKLMPHIAVMTSASSGTHLTKYSNVTDLVVGQKKLIVDDAITPEFCVFDYATTVSMPLTVTIDGALDALAHAIEVFYGISPEKYDLMAGIVQSIIALVTGYSKKIIENPKDLDAREALGLATDLGGYSIMIGGTNGAHLTSFSLVDVTSHGRACGLMNPYYSVFFAPAVEKHLRVIGEAFKEAGFTDKDMGSLGGHSLGLAVAETMTAFNVSIGAETRLGELKGFTDAHIKRALDAAKNPQLKMKLQNMPVPLAAEQVDEYMGPILEAAKTGNFSLIKNM